MHALIDNHYKGRSVIKKRAVNTFFDSVKKPKAACYIGAIYYGLHGKTTDQPVVQELVDEGFEELRRWAEPPCDHDLDNCGTIAGIIIHLNDDHDGRTFSDQKITDWLNLALAKNYPTMEALINANV